MRELDPRSQDATVNRPNDQLVEDVSGASGHGYERSTVNLQADTRISDLLTHRNLFSCCPEGSRETLRPRRPRGWLLRRKAELRIVNEESIEGKVTGMMNNLPAMYYASLDITIRKT